MVLLYIVTFTGKHMILFVSVNSPDFLLLSYILYIVVIAFDIIHVFFVFLLLQLLWILCHN